MVYTIQRFRVVPNPLDTPISVGGYDDGGGNAPNLPNPNYNYPYYPYGPVNFPIPSTNPAPGTIDDIPSNTCSTGQAPHPTTGVCTPINQLPACNTGYARDTTTGQCVAIPVGSGAGNITQVQVPSSTNVGGANVIKVFFTNTSGQTLSYSIRVVIPSLGIDMTSPSISLSNGQSGSIEVTITVPSTAAAGNHSGYVELKAISAAGLLYLQDSEPFTLVVVTSGGTNPPPTTGNAAITAPSSARDGDSFSVKGSGFAAGETVNVALVGVWKSSRSSYNNKSYSDTKTVTATSSGTFSTSLRTPEVPSDVTSTGTIAAKGMSSNRQATRTISIL